jgi:prolyl 4-hydroxylase
MIAYLPLLLLPAARGAAPRINVDSKTSCGLAQGTADEDAFPSHWPWWDYQVLSEDEPRIFYYPQFLSEEEADLVRAIGENRLKASQVEQGRKSDVRSSDVYFMSAEDEFDPVVRALKLRTQHETKIPFKHFEAVQVQRYSEPDPSIGRKDFYQPHFDSIGGGERRIATMIYFLEDVEKGGETIFPLVSEGTTARFGRADLTTDDALALGKSRFEALCADPDGSPFLALKPRKGAAVLFYTLRPGGEHDKFSLHGGCPALSGGGTKWIAQQWIRENPYEMRTSHFVAADFELERHTTVGDEDIVEDFAGGLVLARPTPPAGRPNGQRGADAHSPWGRRLRGKSLRAPGSRWRFCTRGGGSAAQGLAWPGRNTRDSGASTWFLNVRTFKCRFKDPAQRPRAKVRLALRPPQASGDDASGDDGGCCAWTLEVDGCDLSVSGPRAGSPPVTVRLDTGMNAVAWAVENLEGKLGPSDMPLRAWRHRSWVLVNGEVRHAPPPPQTLTLAEKTTFDDTELCIEKSGGAAGLVIGNFMAYSTALSQAEIDRLALNTQWA